jgi:cytochrome c-type biogenesis protein CcmH/NrfF
MIRKGALVLVCVVASVSLSVEADERSELLDKQSYELYQQVFSPFCPGRSLNDCPSSKAHELKIEMRAQLENGVPPQTILEGVFAKFGEKYRAVPAYQGFGKLVWWVPFGFVALGLAIACGLVARRGKRGSAEKSPASSANFTPQISPDIQAQIERELSSLD